MLLLLVLFLMLGFSSCCCCIFNYEHFQWTCFCCTFLWVVAMGQDRLQFSKCGEKQQTWMCTMNVCVCECVWIHHALSQSFIRRGSCLMPNKIFWNFNYFRLCVSVYACVCVCRGQCNTRRMTARAAAAAFDCSPLCCTVWQLTAGASPCVTRVSALHFQRLQSWRKPRKNRHYELGWPNECERMWMRNVFEY